MGQVTRPSTPASRDLAELVEAARHGDGEALGHLLQGYRPYLLRIANHEMSAGLRPKLGASDLVQDTLIEALNCFARFTGRASAELQGWLRTILLRQIAQATERFAGTRKREVQREVSLAVEGLAANQSSPSSCARRQEQAEVVRQILSRLPEHYRQVLVWREWDDLSFAEIAARLDRSVDAVRMLWLRALERFDSEMSFRPRP
jgi:RNA polymerase sigma-70 factor (ECF subfamily)